MPGKKWLLGAVFALVLCCGPVGWAAGAEVRMGDRGPVVEQIQTGLKTAGYFGGRIDGAMMRFVDVMYSLPFIFFVILLMVTFERNFLLMYVAIGAVVWLDMARIVRGQVISLKHKEYVEAAYATGVGSLTIIRRHILPNILGPVIVYVTLTVPQVILIESFISFLGLGVQEPDTSWGVLISQGARYMETAWWTLLFPALFLSVTLFCFNFLGDGIRDALDPKDR